jgi:hypothetical protein
MPVPRPDAEAPLHEDSASVTHRASSSHATYDNKDDARPTSTSLFNNPLQGMTEAEVMADVDKFVEEKGLVEHRDDFLKGALLARVQHTPEGFENVSSLTAEEKDSLRHEVTHRWNQPFMLYFLCTLCAGSAIVQGMDQTAVNGAQVGAHHVSVGTWLTSDSNTTMKSSTSRQTP